jgi:hypothetical protein
VGDLPRNVPDAQRPPLADLARNVKATSLAGGNDSPLLKIMEDLPQDIRSDPRVAWKISGCS